MKTPCTYPPCTETSVRIYHPNGMIVCEQHHALLTRMDAEEEQAWRDRRRARRTSTARQRAIFAQGMLGRN